MKISLNTDFTVPLISKADMKTFLKVDTLITDDDTLIEALVKAATKKIQNYCGISLLTQKWDIYLDSIGDRFELPKPPLQSIEEFSYYDDSYTKYTMPLTSYKLQKYVGITPSEILKLISASWATYTANGNGILIVIKSGYGDVATSVPEDLILGAKMLVAHWYENRESQSIPNEVEMIIKNYKVWYL